MSFNNFDQYIKHKLKHVDILLDRLHPNLYSVALSHYLNVLSESTRNNEKNIKTLYDEFNKKIKKIEEEDGNFDLEKFRIEKVDASRIYKQIENDLIRETKDSGGKNAEAWTGLKQNSALYVPCWALGWKEKFKFQNQYKSVFE